MAVVMTTKVILVCEEAGAKQAYLGAMKPLGVQVDAVSSFRELHKALIERPYHGVMVDLRTKIQAPSNDKGLIHDILERFPVVQLKWEGTKGQIQTLYFGQSKGSGSLEDFIVKECGCVAARTIRSCARRSINFNVIVSKSADFSSNGAERSITIDVSKGGCFIYSCGQWQGTSNVWFIIKELKDDTPILGAVRWRLSWGEAMRIPGIGVKFEDMTKKQLEEMGDKFNI
jgi:hypothetical protein